MVETNGDKLSDEPESTKYWSEDLEFLTEIIEVVKSQRVPEGDSIDIIFGGPDCHEWHRKYWEQAIQEGKASPLDL